MAWRAACWSVGIVGNLLRKSLCLSAVSPPALLVRLTYTSVGFAAFIHINLNERHAALSALFVGDIASTKTAANKVAEEHEQVRSQLDELFGLSPCRDVTEDPCSGEK